MTSSAYLEISIRRCGRDGTLGHLGDALAVAGQSVAALARSETDRCSENSGQDFLFSSHELQPSFVSDSTTILPRSNRGGDMIHGCSQTEGRSRRPSRARG